MRGPAEHIHPEGATVVVAGDLTGVDVEGLLASSLGAWTTSGRGRPVDREPAPRIRRPLAAATERPVRRGHSRTSRPAHSRTTAAPRLMPPARPTSSRRLPGPTSP